MDDGREGAERLLSLPEVALAHALETFLIRRNSFHRHQSLRVVAFSSTLHNSAAQLFLKHMSGLRNICSQVLVHIVLYVLTGQIKAHTIWEYCKVKFMDKITWKLMALCEVEIVLHTKRTQGLSYGFCFWYGNRKVGLWLHAISSLWLGLWLGERNGEDGLFGKTTKWGENFKK